MTDAELLTWLEDFEPRLRPGFLVVDSDGRERVIRNVEMLHYLQAGELLRRLPGVRQIDQFLRGETTG